MLLRASPLRRRVGREVQGKSAASSAWGDEYGGVDDGDGDGVGEDREERKREPERERDG